MIIKIIPFFFSFTLLDWSYRDAVKDLQRRYISSALCLVLCTKFQDSTEIAQIASFLYKKTVTYVPY